MILKKVGVNTSLGIHTNCYIILDEETTETIVVDPGGEVEKIAEMIDILDGNLKYIYLTHCHGDHIGGVSKLKEQKGGKVLIHRLDAEGLSNPQINCSILAENDIKLEADSRVEDKDILHLGNLEIHIIHTPGHTKGGSSLYIPKENMLISGDTLFKGTWGRTDLLTGSFEEIISSITNKLMKLPDDTIVYPGHGEITRIYEEKPIYLELKPGLD